MRTSECTSLLACMLLLLPACGDELAVTPRAPNTRQLALDSGRDVAVGDTGSVSTTAFRITDATLVDPHLFASPVFVGCTDVTHDAPLGRKSVNDEVEASITSDANGDGFLDFSSLLLLTRADADGGAGKLAIARGRCAPPHGRECEFDPKISVRVSDLATQADSAETCLAPFPDTRSPVDYEPPVRPVTAPCFAAEPLSVSFSFGETPVEFESTRFAATHQPYGSIEGLMIGFLSRSQAREIRVKRKPLDTYLPGSPEACPEHDDRDLGPDGEDGWWFYIAFAAEEITIVEPPPRGELGGSTFCNHVAGRATGPSPAGLLVLAVICVV